MGIGAVLVGPEDEKWLPNNVVARQKMPEAAVQTVVTIVAHDEIVIVGNGDRSVVIPIHRD